VAILRLATTARNAAADAVVDRLDVGVTNGAGKIEIRSGAQPATPQDAATGTLLATVVLANPAAGNAASGSATITDPAAVTGVADGGAFPYWARFYDRDNAAVMDCDVTATGGGGAITLSAQITNGVTVDMGAITYTQPQG
jgi:hypothetical protein